MTETGLLPVGATTYRCPLPVCDWTFSQLPPTVPFEEWAARAGSAGVKTMLAIAEQRIARHLETHTSLEWVTEVMRLRGQAEESTADRLRRVANEDIGGNAPWLADELHEVARKLELEWAGTYTGPDLEAS